ncbi:hypothetical protein [Paenibacillus xerothermodurans]|uniref:Uncharacterized protein n=1 Tax=Paenibacillus xerothermodurans TaxID=1977292 RepID=A0A2W1NB77_PAEXE|nr:hypothetical protein [Paenibacillus xerothermodurans]PZE20920.1 hypothetical protein CBW46_009515 [Paenibacillus xerothermodurans]
MVLFQIAIGVVSALILWGFIELTYRTMLWVIGLTVLVSLIIPGAFLFLSGILLVFIGMLATLGILFLIGAFRK